MHMAYVGGGGGRGTNSGLMRPEKQTECLMCEMTKHLRRVGTAFVGGADDTRAVS